jgi:hypothetical protein
MAKRLDLTDARGWQVSSAGVIYKNMRLVEVMSIAGWPAVDLGSYLGPIPPAFIGDPRLWLLDEIVCYEFHGKPPQGFEGAVVMHKDGDESNCAADNVDWATDKSWGEAYDRLIQKKQTEWLMKVDLPRRVYKTKEGRFTNRPPSTPTFVNANNVPGWIPIGA